MYALIEQHGTQPTMRKEVYGTREVALKAIESIVEAKLAMRTIEGRRVEITLNGKKVVAIANHRGVQMYWRVAELVIN